MLPRLNLSKTAFFLCDIQEKLIPTMKEAIKVISVANRMLSVAETLNIPIVVTEQYPKGLGATLPDFNIKNRANCKIFEKTQFSMFTDQVHNHLKELKTESIVIFGLETHVCVYQSTKDLLDAKYNVFLASDGISSRFPEDREIALKQLQNFGAVVSTSESLIFELIKDAKNEKFRELSALIKTRNE